MRLSPKSLAAAALLVACQNEAPAPPSPPGPPPAAPPGAVGSAPSGGRGALWIDDQSPVAITPDDPSWGPPGAPVTIVRATPLNDKDPLLKPGFRRWLAATFGEGTTRLVWLPFYVNEIAAFAALGCGVAELSGPRGFWSFVDALGAHADSGVPEAEFDRWAAGAGVDRARALEQMRAPRCQKGTIDRAAYAEKLFRDYGSTTFINGVRSYVVLYPDAASVEGSFGPVVGAEIAAAKAAVARGTPPERVYVERSTANVGRGAYTSEDPARPVLDTSTVWRVSAGKGPATGPDDALVTAVLFCAPTHPACRWVYDRARALVAKHSLRLVLRPYDGIGPCDAEAVALATEAAAEKGPHAYYEALDALNGLQPKISVATDGSGDTSAWNAAVRAGKAPVCAPAAMRALSGKLKVRYAAYERRLKARAFAAEFGANRDESRAVDGGTALFVNGRRLSFYGPGDPAPGLDEAGLEAFLERVVAEEEASAREKVKQGADPKKLYESLTRDGYGKKR